MSREEPRRAPLLEVRLHAFSPFPPVVNGILASAALYAIFLALTTSFGPPVIENTQTGARFSGSAWAALVMSLIFGAATTMPALSQRQWVKALPDLTAVLDAQGARQAEAMAVGPPVTRLRAGALAFAAGALGGVALNVWLMGADAFEPGAYLRSIRPWFDIVNPLLFGLGARAVQLLRDDDQEMKALTAGHLQVDLAHLERHFVFGRLALRGALAWLVMTAIILLFFVDAAPVAISVGAVGLAFLAAAYVFASTIGPAVRETAKVRDAALGEVRTRLHAAGGALMRGQGAGEADGPSISELAAYEAWLEKRPIWPISAPITRRLALYGLIPVLAWFGAAAAEMLLNRLA